MVEVNAPAEPRRTKWCHHACGKACLIGALVFSCASSIVGHGPAPAHRVLDLCRWNADRNGCDRPRAAAGARGTLSNVEYDADSPVWRPWLAALSRHHRYLRYDQRGCGLSDRDIRDFSLGAMVADLEAVTATLDQQPFPLIGMSQGGAVAIEFARRHPERVSRLVLVGAYARGALRRPAGKGQRREAEALLELVRLGWGRDNPALRQVFTSQFIPGGTPEQHRWWTDLERRTASPEVAAAILWAFYQIDVTAEARGLDLPVLVMHARGDARVPFEEGRLLAALVPGARFVPLESDNHVLLESEPAWGRLLTELRGFLGAGGSDVVSRPGANGLTNAERQVLGLLLQVRTAVRRSTTVVAG